MLECFLKPERPKIEVLDLTPRQLEEKIETDVEFARAYLNGEVEIIVEK